MQQFPDESPWGIDRAINWTNEDFGYHITNYSSSVTTIIDQWKLYLPTIIRSVNHSKPVCFHCGAGADKTGTMALMLLALLGVSEQDIDIDYELTAFYYGIFSMPRTRTLASYVNYKNALSSFDGASGLNEGCIKFALSLGITAKELNEFRANCIDGTPTPIVINRSVTNNLTNCTNSSSAQAVADGERYVATITANSGYKMSTISVTMGGQDVTTDYVSGYSINIPSVNGNIVITATAIVYQPTNILDEVGYYNNMRVSLSSTAAWKRVAATGECATGAIRVDKHDIIRVKGFNFSVSHYGIAQFFTDDQGTPAQAAGINDMRTGNFYNFKFADFTISDDNIMTIDCHFNSAGEGVNTLWLVLSGVCSDGANAFVTKNEPLPD